MVLALSIEQFNVAATDRFIQKVGFDLVLDDPDRVGYAQFGPGGSASRYVIINGLADSPSHKQWEVLFSAKSFDPARPNVLRMLIESIKPPVMVAPEITRQPQSQAVPAGAAVTLSVAATGTAPLSYQWHKDGQLIPDATASALLLASVTAADAGEYSVQVRNTAGTQFSDTVTLTVETPPPPPPRISGFQRLPTGVFELTVSGTQGHRYRAEVSADLRSWSRLADLSATAGGVLVRDEDAAQSASRFYRVVGLAGGE
ncbi:MAG: immunoglobulin domain-containing protein [Verrucomicrobia bacterium]|nr:immunoglobulin domain-containing protein [Verrucomicrobiota bacterium]